MSVSLRHFMLGLLTRQSMSGYDIKRMLQSLNWLIGNLSFGSLYPALHALLKDGLVTVDVESRQAKPSRKIYSITTDGRQALDEWVNRPARASSSVKAFVMRLILADNFSHAGLITQLYQRRAQIAAQRGMLEQSVSALDGGAGLGQHLALEHGLALADAELAWLDSALERLTQQPLPVEAIAGD